MRNLHKKSIIRYTFLLIFRGSLFTIFLPKQNKRNPLMFRTITDAIAKILCSVISTAGQYAQNQTKRKEPTMVFTTFDFQSISSFECKEHYLDDFGIRFQYSESDSIKSLIFYRPRFSFVCPVCNSLLLKKTLTGQFVCIKCGHKSSLGKHAKNSEILYNFFKHKAMQKHKSIPTA